MPQKNPDGHGADASLPPSPPPTIKRVATGSIILNTPWYTSRADHTQIEADIRASELELFAKRQIRHRDSWSLYAAKSIIAFATMRSLFASVQHRELCDIEAQELEFSRAKNKGGLKPTHMVVTLGYRYSKAIACVWLTLAVLTSVMLGVICGLVWRDLGLGVEFGTGMLAFLTGIHKIVSTAVRLGEDG